MILPPPEEIRRFALELGWDDVGITPAQISLPDQDAYHEWIAQGYQGDLAYMENAKRCDPQALFPGAQTAIIFLSYYKQPKQEFAPQQGVVASYARGRDYHHVHRKRIKKFIHWLENYTGQTGIAKGFSDSSPLLEKALAVQAGLGWFGKNTLLIHRKWGTFTLIAGVLTTLTLDSTSIPVEQIRLPRCGTCTRCLDACPTQAFVNPYHLDATRCLSYHLIESKKPLPEDIQARNPGYIFGCDICQDVCPHNARKPNSTQEAFQSSQGQGSFLTLKDLEDLEKTPEKLFGTPLQRRGVQGLKETFTSLEKKS